MKGDDVRDALMCECGHPRRDHDTADAGDCLHGLVMCECPEFVEQSGGCVVVTGVGTPARVMFDREPDADDLTAVAAIVEAAQRIELTPEQIERQRLAAERRHERNARIRGER